MELEQIRIDEQKLDRINKGHNFYNLKQTEKKYFVEVMLESTIDLLSKDESVIVKTDLPIKSSDWRYEREFNAGDFVKELKSFCEKPFVKIKTGNRKNKISSWKLDNIKENFRERILKFSDIRIVVGKLAEKRLKYNFEQKIKELLKLQKTATDKRIQKQVDKFVMLREKILLLENFIGKKQNDYYSYSYDKPKDDTIKLTLMPLEYNEKLKEIEIEIKKIAKKLNIENIGDFDYLKIEKQISYEEWLKMYEVDLRENFENYDDGSEYENFEEYAKSLYKESGGIVDEEWTG